MSAFNEMVIYLLIKSIQCLPGLKVVSSSGQPFSVTLPSLESLVNQRKLTMNQDESFLNNKIPCISLILQSF